MASASVQASHESNIHEHREPEKPLVYEPPDLHGRKHVEKIATEYRVREDECLADRLQNEEFELHFGKNKLDNKILHMDVKTAKSIYLKEVEESGMLSKNELTSLCKDDVFIAEEIERRMNENKDLETQTKTALEMQDEEFAIYLQAKEKQKLDQERKERLQRRVQQDREAAERLQRELNSQAVEEEALRQGVNNIKLRKGEWAVECEVGSRPPRSSEDIKALKADQAGSEKSLRELEMEQRRFEEERDRKIAIKLQRAEAEEYQRAKQEKQFRRAQTERRRDDPVTERRRQLQAVDCNGNPRAITPPERRRIGSSSDRVDSSSPRGKQRMESPVRKPVVQTDSPKRHRENNAKVLQSVDATGRPIAHGSPKHNDRTPRKPSSSTSGEIRTPRNKPPPPPPEEGIYLTAVDAIGAVKAMNNGGAIPRTNQSSNQSPRSRTQSDYTKRTVPKNPPPNSTSSENRDAFTLRDESKVNTGTAHRNIAADIDPTYSTINHFSQSPRKDVEIRAAPVVQNVKRNSASETGDKKKKKWFSSKK